jgi:hypothetical protein
MAPYDRQKLRRSPVAAAPIRPCLKAVTEIEFACNCLQWITHSAFN